MRGVRLQIEQRLKAVQILTFQQYLNLLPQIIDS